MNEGRIVKEIPEGSCPDCGVCGHLHVEENGFISDECRKCGWIFDEWEVPYDRDHDAEAKDKSLGL